MIFFYFNLLESFHFNQRIIIYFYLIIFLIKWLEILKKWSSINERKFCRNENSRKNESFEECIRNERRAYESVDEKSLS